MLDKLKGLSVDLATYGAGSVAIQAAGLLLLPLYVRLLTPADYGVIAVLLVVEQVLRVLFRWGVDAAFMRFYFDCADTVARQRLASTIFFFVLASNGCVLAFGLLSAGMTSHALFRMDGWATPLRLVFLNVFLGSLSFLPFHVLRIEGRARLFVTLTFAANLSTLVTKLVLVAGLRMGVLGVFLADTIVAVGLLVALLPRYAALVRPYWSWPQLRSCLAFGLPRVPHGIAQQVMAGSDRYFMSLFLPMRDVGIYNVGASLGLGLKLFLSAFETAWAPFYFAEMATPDGKQTFRAVTTYGMLVLALLAAGLAAIAQDLVRLMTIPQFYGAARVVPWIGLSVVMQGAYLLTSIGLNITKRTGYYPLATGIAAAVCVAANLVLVPRFGIQGAAWASTLSYTVLAATALVFSQRVYPIALDWPRLARLAIAAGVAVLASQAVLPSHAAPLLGLLVRGTTAVLAFGGTLVLLGFFEPREVRQMRQLVQRLQQRRQRPRNGAGGAGVGDDE